MFIYTQAGIRIIDIQIEKKDRHMSRVMHIKSKKVAINMNRTQNTQRAQHR